MGARTLTKTLSQTTAHFLQVCVVASFLVLGGTRVDAVERDAGPTGSIAGRVIDEHGTGVSGAMVVACDGQSSIPVMQKNSRPFTDDWPRGGRDSEWALAITDKSGRFQLGRLKAGTYRLVAQSWGDGEPPRKSPLERAAREVYLRGIAEDVKVQPYAATRVILRPLGKGTLNVDATSTEKSPLLLLSTSPTAADATLANGAILGEFLRNIIGAVPMKGNRVTVRGVPEGKLYCFLVVMADEPGFGSGVAKIEPGRVAELSVPIYATWANPRPAPPKDVVPLMNELRTLRKSPDGGKFVAEQLPDLHLTRFRSTFHWFAQLAPFFKRPIEMPSGRKANFSHLMAALQHLQIERAIERGGERTVQDVIADLKFLHLDPSRRPSKPAANRKVSYEAAFRDLYEELGRRYPNFKLKQIDWAAVGEELLPRVKSVKTDDEFGRLCMELVARLQDSHAQLLPGAAGLPQLSFPQWDPGFACLIDDLGKPVIYHVTANGPAAKAGIRPGMTVVSVNGTTVADRMREYESIIARYVGFSSSRYLRYHAARGFARQAKQDAPVSLVLADPSGKRHGTEITASLGIRYVPRLPVPIPGIRDTANVSWKKLDSGIGYLYVRRIRADLIESLDRAVGALQGCKGLVIDVRGNSGGGFDGRRAHLNFALDRDGEEADRPRFRGPIALLIDARCISAGEGWASWFLANKRARVFGEATAGASARKTVYQLKNGLFAVRFPVKAYRGYLDRPIEFRGLEPDVPLMPDAEDIWNGRDTVLLSAERFLRNQD